MLDEKPYHDITDLDYLRQFRYNEIMDKPAEDFTSPHYFKIFHLAPGIWKFHSAAQKHVEEERFWLGLAVHGPVVVSYWFGEVIDKEYRAHYDHGNAESFVSILDKFDELIVEKYGRPDTDDPMPLLQEEQA